VRESEVQTKATRFIEVLGNRRRDEALELIDVEIEGFGIASQAWLVTRPIIGNALHRVS
jgi:hypothetical protein